MKLTALMLLVVGALSYAYGVVSHAYRFFPMEQVGFVRRALIPEHGEPVDMAVFTDTRDRVVVDCASIDRKAAVILAMGQSNAANHGGARYHPVRKVFNFNWADGRCYRAKDPLLGASGEGGSVWTRLGDELIESGRYDQVLIIPIAIGGTSVRVWAGSHGPAAQAIKASDVLQHAGLRITHVLWHQGESDHEMRKEVYTRLFSRMAEYLQENGINAPLFVATTTICNNYGANQIREAQRELPRRLTNVFAGPDTDALDSIYDRSPNLCHFSERGLAMHARMWLHVILNHDDRPAGHRS